MSYFDALFKVMDKRPQFAPGWGGGACHRVVSLKKCFWALASLALSRLTRSMAIGSRAPGTDLVMPVDVEIESADWNGCS